jgi:hypothetical protein
MTARQKSEFCFKTAGAILLAGIVLTSLTAVFGEPKSWQGIDSPCGLAVLVLLSVGLIFAVSK